MKLKKLLSLVIVATFMASVLCACGSSSSSSKSSSAKSDDTTEAATEAEAEAPADGAFVQFNGNNISLGVKWDDVKDKLGSESKPSETIEPCGGGDYIQIMHYYDGFTVTTLRDEKVVSLEVPQDGADTALFQGKVKKGDKTDDVKAALGDPESEDEYMLSYSIDNADVMIYVEDGVVTSGMYMEKAEEQE